jgi:hypothetical protein
MSDKSLQHEKKHRKLVRSPEKLSPCDLDPLLNPSLHSATKNVQQAPFSPTKSQHQQTKCCYNDQFPPQTQQMWLNNNDHHQPHPYPASSLPPSSSTPSIALYRKPSITIKYSKDDDLHQESSAPSSLSRRQQQISKSIDSNHHPFNNTISSEMKDQMSNNFLINFPGLYNPSTLLTLSPTKKSHPQTIEKNLSPFNYNNDEFSSSSNVFNNVTTTSSCDSHHRSSSQSSLNLNLINQQHHRQHQFIDGSILSTTTTGGIPIVPMNLHQQQRGGGHIVFSSNNPFLNDNFDAITNDVSDGNKLNNFFNIDGDRDELLFMPDDDMTAATSTTSTNALLMKGNSGEESHQEAQLLKNKREKFSNASPTMKICLVVSPPTNKVFHVSARTLIISEYFLSFKGEYFHFYRWHASQWQRRGDNDIRAPLNGIRTERMNSLQIH